MYLFFIKRCPFALEYLNITFTFAFLVCWSPDCYNSVQKCVVLSSFIISF